MNSPRNLLFVAGDVSGDVHCARLARLILQKYPACKITALGGPHLQGAGAHLLADTSGFGVIGFAAALSLVPRALRLQAQVLAWLETHPVDAIILCDWGAFNARLLPKLSAKHGRTLFYFPPRSWQKNGAGGLGIAREVDAIATPFEWSAERLNAAGAKAHWVGHPVLELRAESGDRRALRAEFGVGNDEKMIALLPGSRALEWKYIAPHINDAVTILKREPELKFVAAIAPGAQKRACKYLQAGIRVVENRSAQVLAACDAAIVKSGTSTLEACALNAPQVVVYDVPYLLRLQWKWTLQKKVPFVAMPNILLGREVVRELLGDDCRAARIAAEVKSLLEAERRAELLDGYTAVHQALGAQLPGTATQRTLGILENLLVGDEKVNE